MFRVLKHWLMAVIVIMILVASFGFKTDVLVSRIKDIYQYTLKQKQYVFDGFKDPNTYADVSSKINDLEKTVTAISDLTGATSTVTSTPKVSSGKLVVVSTTTVPDVKKTVTPKVVSTVKPVIAPPPVFSFPTSTPSITIVDDSNGGPGQNSTILTLTNKERSRESLSVLKSNYLLDKIADLRLEDLFDNQYFEHESPDGKDVSSLAKVVGYDYLLIGENLALGNFAGDQGIVEAWMESPGHRANIVNPKYTELGVAKRNGQFNGKNVTIAVQIFGEPSNVCAKPNPATKELISNSTATITKMQTEAKKMYDALNAIKSDPNLDRSYYNQKVQEYNYFAKQVNDAVVTLKSIVDQYNLAVNQYNSCI